ncbi:MAG TPA: glutathione S-transferase family protein [Candidatus Binataceae bacterium]|jgi:glutathione S-transferase|nr:glutathione S-transferase family protein [Candidatus Binataceae bacterium]
MMQLFSFATSPYARKVRIVLDYKGVPYESCERCYSLDRKPDLKDASRRAEVPVLVLPDHRVIYDSTIICEFLEQVYPDPPVFPKDAFERARTRMIEDLCDRTFDAIGFGYYFAILRKDAPESSAMQEAAKTECRALVERLEGELGERAFFGGDAPTLADFAAITHAPLVRAMRLDTANLPGFNGWLDRMRKIPAVAADHDRAAKAWQGKHNLAAEFEGPDGRIHWRDSRLEWPIRQGFIDLIAREYHAGRMMFPPQAA